MKRLKYLLASAGLLALLLAPGLANADVNDFTVTNFRADETLTNADPQGELHIIEHINVTYTDFNHGILRAIPNAYKNHTLQLKVNSITSETGAPTQYTTYGSNGNTVLKIGDAGRTITGPQEYTIDYTLHNVISFYNGHDELYWDINGDQWGQPFDKVSVTLHLPEGLQQTEKPSCYTGSFGSTSQNCTITDENNTIKSTTTQPLTAYQTLTFVASFKPGYFHPSTWYETLGEYGKQIAAIVVPIVLLGGSGFIYWWRNGRDPKGRGVIVPQYEAPDGLKPLQVDGLVDFNAGTTGITATIIDLAIRGYIQIVETKENKKLRKDTLTYSLKLLKSDFTGLDENEQALLTALFTTAAAGETVDVSKQKSKLYTTVSVLQSNVKKELQAGGYFRSKTVVPGAPKKHTGLKILLGIVALVFVFGWAGPLVIAGIVIGGFIGVMFLIAMDARTEKGVAAKEHVEGLKLYLNVAEKDRLQKLQSPDAKYASKAPKKTVELFEKLLPYAMVLGVEKGWAEQFKDLYKSPPDWYSGNWTTFNAAYLATSLNSGIGGAVNSAFSAPSSSGSSGSGGGGFSGGGGGGGGGGGW